jgi:hypothetical protein
VSNDKAIPCPFTYADGHRCGGSVYRARAYGPVSRGEGYVRREDMRKYRLWCSEKDDHAGVISSGASKERMEFYPDELEPGLEDRIWEDDKLLS